MNAQPPRLGARHSETKLNSSSDGASKKIAVIGSGISGLSAAWLLAQQHQVIVFEKDKRPGGHSHTVEVDEGDQTVDVDTGFIVYNLATYPNLCALFDYLGVGTEASDMSFAVSADEGAFEYAGSDLNGLLAQRENLLSPRFWRMTLDLLRFYRQAPKDLSAGRISAEMSLGAYLDANRYSEAFIQDHLLPMAAAIWSSPAVDMRAYPARSFLAFFVNHGLLQLTNRPQWRTVRGGSKRYLEKMMARAGLSLKLSSGAQSITRLEEGVLIKSADGAEEFFDAVVIGAHADEALSTLSDPSKEEQAILGAFAYQPNRAVLHRDPGLMPKRRAAWSSWNYLSEDDGEQGRKLCVTYWMNKLQPLPTERDYFVTLNPIVEPDPALVIRDMNYMHPMFDQGAMAAQARLWDIQGQRGTWFCGSYFGSGFHEDGLQSGLAVAEALSSVRRPWSVENESGRIPMPDGVTMKEGVHG